MSIKYAVEKHCYASPARVLAQNYGAYIFSVKLDTATDNGNFVAKGEYIGLDQYAEAEATKIDATIVDKAPNGNWYVEINDNPDHALFVYQKPLIPEESPRALTNISNFYNEAGETVRCYDLVYGDIVEISAEGFEGEPVKGAAITTISGKKLVIA